MVMKTASWVIRNKISKEVIFETFDETLIEKLNNLTYEAVSILDYLVEFNKRVINEKFN